MNHFPDEGRSSEECRSRSEAVVFDIFDSPVCWILTVLALAAVVASYFTKLPPPVLFAMAGKAAIAHPVESAASFFGVFGTLLIATRSRWAGWGLVAFLASNVGWLWFSHVHGHQWMFMQQVAFTVSSLVGVWFWLVKGRGGEQ